MEQKTIYYISEAAKKVQVESHVLRYWEDELQLPIMRNEMGHRYYTEQDIKQLQDIKKLKEQGLQLRAIRTILFRMPDTCEADGTTPSMMSNVVNLSTISGASAVSDASNLLSTLNTSVKMNENNYGQKKGAIEVKKAGNTASTEVSETEAVAPTELMENEQEERRMSVEITEKTEETYGKEVGKKEAFMKEILNEEACGKEVFSKKVSNKEVFETEMDIVSPQRFVVSLQKEKEEPSGKEQVFDDADRNRKAARLQYLLQHMITEAVRSANRELCTDVKESILKELDYQFRMQEERDEERWKKEEEHYRKIDEMIRERHRPKERLVRGKKKSSGKDDPISL